MRVVMTLRPRILVTWLGANLKGWNRFAGGDNADRHIAVAGASLGWIVPHVGTFGRWENARVACGLP
jgi:hypothetical protein